MRAYGISEVLALANSQATEQDKINFLRQNDSHELRIVLQFALDNRVKWLLPEGEPPFRGSPHLNTEGRLKEECRRFYLFVEQNGIPLNDRIKPAKRQELFIQMLESIDIKDAKMMVCVKDKKLPFDGITPELVAKAFPNMYLQYTPTKTTEE